MHKKYINIFLFSILFFSCEKETNNTIYGKWELIEIFNGYVNGGDFKWIGVSKENSHIIELAANGGFIRTQNTNGNNLQCKGTYLLNSDSTLEINTNCNIVPERFKLTESSKNVIMLDMRVREGVIRFKYVNQ